MLLLAVRIAAAHCEKTEMRIAAAEVPFHQIADPGVERAVGRPKALVVDSEEVFEVVLDDVLEIIGRRTRRVAGAARRGEDGHRRGRRRATGRAGERAGQGGTEQGAGGTAGGRREDGGRLQ